MKLYIQQVCSYCKGSGRLNSDKYDKYCEDHDLDHLTPSEYWEFRRMFGFEPTIKPLCESCDGKGSIEGWVGVDKFMDAIHHPVSDADLIKLIDK